MADLKKVIFTANTGDSFSCWCDEVDINDPSLSHESFDIWEKVRDNDATPLETVWRIVLETARKEGIDLSRVSLDEEEMCASFYYGNLPDEHDDESSLEEV